MFLQTRYSEMRVILLICKSKTQTADYLIFPAFLSEPLVFKVQLPSLPHCNTLFVFKSVCFPQPQIYDALLCIVSALCLPQMDYFVIAVPFPCTIHQRLSPLALRCDQMQICVFLELASNSIRHPACSRNIWGQHIWLWLVGHHWSVSDSADSTLWRPRVHLVENIFFLPNKEFNYLYMFSPISFNLLKTLGS